MNEALVTATKTALCGQLDTLLAAINTLAEPLTETQFWQKPVDPGNSFGHLVLHLTGNLRHFVGAQLGQSRYIRDREREFTETSPPEKAVALSDLAEAVAEYRHVVEGLSEDRLIEPHPDPKFGQVINALVRLVAHFALHRGQMSYIARWVTQDPR